MTNLDSSVLKSRDITLSTKMHIVKASLVDQMVKNLPAMRETRVQSLGWEDPLKKEMATHSSILAWRIPWTKEPGRLQSKGSQRVRQDWATNTFTFIVFPVVICGCKSWTLKKVEHWRTDAFTLWCWRRFLSPLDNKEIKLVNPKGNQPWILTGRTDAEAEAEASILWPSDAKSHLIGKEPDVGKDWGQKKGTTEDEMDGWYHQLNGHEFEQTLGDSEGQGSLVCCSLGVTKSRTRLSNWTTKTNIQITQVPKEPRRRISIE